MRTLRFCGSVLAIIGVIFVAVRLYSYAVEINFSRFALFDWFLVVLLAIAYAVSNLMLVMAWKSLLAQTDVVVRLSWAIKTYGVSQIAKYIPGNIFHLAGRQAIGMSSGISSWSLAKTTVWELVLIASAGTVFGLLALPLLNWDLPTFISYFSFLFAIIVVASLIGLRVGYPMARAFIWYACFLTVSGTLFLGLVELITTTMEGTSGNVGVLVGAYVLAWLIGLITPGAPAGIGIREVVLISLLNGIVPELDLLLAVIIGRIVTACGDTMFFLVAYMMPVANDVKIHSVDSSENVGK